MSLNYPIIINKSHYKGGSTYTYRFGTSVEMGNVDIALGSASIWYSWPNIKSTKTNNQFQILHPAATTTNTTLTITVPDGGYEIADLNKYLRWYLISNGYYLQNSTTGDQIVYCEFRVNASTYSVEFVGYPLPTSLPSGFTNGGSIVFPSTTRAPQLVVTQSAFGNLIGFETGTYPATQATSINTQTSSKVPVLSDVQNIVLTLDSALNPFAPNSKVIHSISPAGVSYGHLITSEPNELSYVPQGQGFRQELTIQLCNQNLQPIDLLDTDVTIKLILRKRE
jgi:hypothetical protein